MAMRARQRIRVPRRGRRAATDGDEFETRWKQLSTALNDINTKNSSAIQFEDIYRNAYHMTLLRRGDELFGRVRQVQEEWLRDHVQKRVSDSIGAILLHWYSQPADVLELANERRDAAEKFLWAIKEAWEDHLLCMRMMADVLLYMDRSSDEQSIFVVAMALFRDHVVRAIIPLNSEPTLTVTISSLLVSSLLFMIRLERAGHFINRGLVRSCAYLLEGLYETPTEEPNSALYLTVFEPVFLEASRNFYLKEGREMLANGDATAFCRRVTQRILEEHERAQSSVAPTTENKVLEVLDECLIARNIAEVVNLEGTGVWSMLENDQLSTLKSIYLADARVDESKTAVTSVVKKYIVEIGLQINDSVASTQSAEQSAGKKSEKGKEKEKPLAQQTESAIQWVDAILALKRRFDAMWEESFCRDPVLEKAIVVSFSDFINANSRSPEHLSLFFDENLKKGIKGKTDDEVDTLLDSGIVLLRYIKNKDLFENYYKKHLARRLLLKRAISMDAERQMISKTKMEVGNQFTQRIENMFKDITISEDLTTSYKEFVMTTRTVDMKPVELDIHMLTSTMWPLDAMTSQNHKANQTTCVFPPEVEDLKQNFSRFYLGKHSGRRLAWHGNMGTADIRATFQRSNGKVQRYELNVSTHAMIILCLFNEISDDESLTTEEIQACTNIPGWDLVRNLQSLAVAPKTRILKKEPMSKDIKAQDRFSFNNDFHSPFVKIRIGVVSGGVNKLETQEERKETEDKMREERGGSVEAAIVRIMKLRKKLNHTQLMTEVISQLSSRFNPDVEMIKRRIDSLMDREYLMRLPDDPATYGYLA